MNNSNTTATSLKVLFVLYALIAVVYWLVAILILATSWLMFEGPTMGNPLLWLFLASLPGYLLMHTVSTLRIATAKDRGASNRELMLWALLPAIGIARSVVSYVLWNSLCHGSFGMC